MGAEDGIGVLAAPAQDDEGQGCARCDAPGTGDGPGARDRDKSQGYGAQGLRAADHNAFVLPEHVPTMTESTGLFCAFSRTMTATASSGSSRGYWRQEGWMHQRGERMPG